MLLVSDGVAVVVATAPVTVVMLLVSFYVVAVASDRHYQNVLGWVAGVTAVILMLCWCWYEHYSEQNVNGNE